MSSSSFYRGFFWSFERVRTIRVSGWVLAGLIAIQRESDQLRTANHLPTFMDPFGHLPLTQSSSHGNPCADAHGSDPLGIVRWSDQVRAAKQFAETKESEMKRFMRKSVLRFSLTVLAIATLSSCASAQDYSGSDLSTVDGVNAAREAKLGRKLDSYSNGCVEIPKQLPGIVLIGGFAHDRGCMLSEAIIDKRGEPMSNATSRVALNHLGWNTADVEKRKALSLTWAQYGLLAFESSLTAANNDFKPGVFQPPQATLQDDGSVAVSLWVQRAAGMQCETAYDKYKFTFLKDGTLSERTRENSFSIPCKSGNE